MVRDVTVLSGYWTIPAAAAELGLNEDTLRYRLLRNRTPLVRLGTVLLVKLEDARSASVRRYERREKGEAM